MPRAPLEQMSARCGVYEFLQKSAPPSPRLSIPGSATESHNIAPSFHGKYLGKLNKASTVRPVKQR